jgi:3-methyladenine DNA glycosylase AlkD
VLRRRAARSTPPPSSAAGGGDRFADLVAALEEKADASRADAMAAYMRHMFEFLGLPAPVRRAQAGEFQRSFAGADEDTLLGAAERLFSDEFPAREYDYVATDLLRTHWRQLTPASLGRLRALVQTSSWWDSVDPLAHVVGVLVLNHRELRADMDEWLVDEDRWVARVALLHQLGWKAEADPDWQFRASLARGDDEDFFLRKAIGWALRDLARSYPDEVRDFVEDHRGEISELSAEEATKHL